MSRSKRLALVVALSLAAVGVWLFARHAPEPETTSLPAGADAGRSEKPLRRFSAPPTAPLRLAPGMASDAPAGERATFKGRVVSSSTGEGIAGAELTFEHRGAAIGLSCGAGGEFQFSPAQEGVYTLAAITAEGYLPFAPDWGESPVALNAATGHRVSGLVFQLSPALEYEGRVLAPDGGAVSGAEVRMLEAPGRAELMPLADRFVSDSAGRFWFRAPDDSLLEARHPDFAPGRARLDFSSQVSHSLHLRLGTKAVEAPASQSVAGTVVDARGSPLAGALVSARPLRTEEGRTSRLVPELSARTGPEGEFEIAGLDPGRYDVSASLPGFAPATEEAVRTPRRELVLTLRSGARLRGSVREASSGIALASFTVVLFSARGPLERDFYRATSFIDASGEYRMEGISAGPYAVVAASHGYAPSAEAMVDLGESGEVIADFRLLRGGKLFGRVLQAGSKAPVPQAMVTLEGGLVEAAGALPLLSSAQADQGGRFELSGLAAGRRSITVLAQGHHGRIMAGLEVREGEGIGPLEIELTPLEPGEQPRLELVGIGAVLSPRGKSLRVESALAGGGAAEVGLAQGDEILRVDGVAVAELGFEGAINRIRGVEGTAVLLGVRKAGGQDLELRTPRRRIRR
ncbi:MAG: carboxypeptidase regulatory-like domain-containing protein [Myxococcales bacterium]|nr:carboxypeptidase regulatory-like domain-containing protein [Myxococcales bacterium]